MNIFGKSVVYTAAVLILLVGTTDLYGRSDTGHLAAYHYSLGVLHMLDENPGEAAREFEKAWRYDPAAVEIATELATAYVEKGETAKAIAIAVKNVSGRRRWTK